jgi:glycosyltransferase involved in cell wall biosynthesis
MLVSVVTYSKSRLDQLKECLPTVMAQTHQPVELIVVDYACPERSGDWVEANYPTAKVVRYPAAPDEWNMNKARNAGIRATSGEYVLLIDADTLLFPTCVQDNLTILRANKARWARYRGNMLIERQLAYETGGYNELFIHGYGPDDSEYYKRLKRGGYPTLTYALLGMQCTDHSEELRLKYQKITKAQSSYRNRMIFGHKGLP